MAMGFYKNGLVYRHINITLCAIGASCIPKVDLYQKTFILKKETIISFHWKYSGKSQQEVFYFPLRSFHAFGANVSVSHTAKRL